MKIVSVKALPLNATFEQIYGGIENVPKSLLTPSATHVVYPRYGQFTTIVAITADNGVTGYGEAYGLPNAIFTASVVNNLMAPMLIGRDPMRINQIWNDLMSLPITGGHSRGFIMEAISGIDQSLWDLKGKLLNVPAHLLLGGKISEKIYCYASPIMYLEDTVQTAAKAKEYIAAGFTAIKLKVGRDIQTDALHVEAVRQAAGPDIKILLDVNCAYDVTTAVNLAREVEQFNIYWIEEPIPSENAEGYRFIRRKIDIPIATGENEYSTASFRQLIAKEAVDIVMPNLAKAGGITGCNQIAALAQAFSVKFSPHGVGSGINIAASIQLMSACSNSLIFEYNQLLNPLRKEIMTNPIEFDAGFINVSDRPGLGVDINMETVNKYLVKCPN